MLEPESDLSPRRLGLLCGGGDAPGLNAVIRAVVLTATHVYGAETVGVLDGFAGLLEERYRHLYPEDVRDLISQGGTVLGTTNRDNPFRVPTEDGGTEDRSDEVVSNARDAGLEVLVVLGGDGTLHIAHELSNKGLPVVGVPKTIDNDLRATRYTFGFWTAIGTATEALDRLRDTAESHHRVMVLEVMGRHAGWIALHAGLAGAADVILIPEIPYVPEHVVEEVRARRGRGQAYSIVVVAEGAYPVDGDKSYRDRDPRAGAPRLGGAGDRLVGQITERMEDVEARCTVLGHLQRGGSPVPMDRILATSFGERAAHLALTGRTGRMVCLTAGGEIDDVDLETAVEQTKAVDPEGALVSTARSLGISFGDRPPGPPDPPR